MSELQWNLLNTNAPAQVAASFNPVGAFQEGMQSGQKMRMNELAMEKTRQDMEYAPMKVYAQMMGKEATAAKNTAAAEKVGVEAELKKYEVVRQSANTVANAPDELILDTAIQEATKNVSLLGGDEAVLAKTIDHINGIYRSGGPKALRDQTQVQGMNAQLKVTAMLGQSRLEQGDQRIAMQQQQGDVRNQIAATNAQTAQGNLAVNQQRLNQPTIQYINTGGEQVPINKKAPLAEQQILTNTMKPAQDQGEPLTQQEIDFWGANLNNTGKGAPLGMGNAGDRRAIAKSAAAQALGISTTEMGNKTPSEAALSILTKQSDTKAIQGSLNFLDKQIAAMGSFSQNLGMQVDKVGELAKDLETADARLLNIPIRAVRGRLQGSALQAKYDMYLTEISGEIAKLATGSSASISELSVSAREKWEKIHDPNLSVKDMMSLLQETKAAAAMRVKSVEDQLQRTREKMVNRPEVGVGTAPAAAAPKTIGRFQIEVQ